MELTAKSMLRQFVPPVVWSLASRAKRGTRTPPPREDAQVKSLRDTIPGWLNAGNVRAFDRCIAAMPEGAVIEIGCYAGLSANAILHFLQKHGRRAALFSADPWVIEGPAEPAGSGLGEAEWLGRRRAYIRDTYERATRLHSAARLPHHFEVSSDAFFADWQAGAVRTDFFGREARLGGPIAFAYIDGDHSRDQVWKDFTHVDRHLAKGGFVLFDDSGFHPLDGAAQSAARAAAMPAYRIVAKAPHYCLQKTG